MSLTATTFSSPSHPSPYHPGEDVGSQIIQRDLQIQNKLINTNLAWVGCPSSLRPHQRPLLSVLQHQWRHLLQVSALFYLHLLPLLLVLLTLAKIYHSYEKLWQICSHKLNAGITISGTPRFRTPLGYLKPAFLISYVPSLL